MGAIGALLMAVLRARLSLSLLKQAMDSTTKLSCFVIFILTFFFDYFERAFIIVPLLAPVADKLGSDPIGFGVLLAVNMQTSFLHPPFGFALFFLRSVASEKAKITSIYWGAVPFVIIQLLAVGLVIMFPGLISHDGGMLSPACSRNSISISCCTVAVLRLGRTTMAPAI